ncbi:hypothetical protein ROHU_010615 [Labeo rohita]|uniref:Uncharacterized protein n=1 Tax=Labeo rohita TaxID=84645 RepID=A0A498LTD7_LABRO|nr:hypothetical protein ROHU_010615 [Labeo rohita]
MERLQRACLEEGQKKVLEKIKDESQPPPSDPGNLPSARGLSCPQAEEGHGPPHYPSEPVSDPQTGKGQDPFDVRARTRSFEEWPPMKVS